MAEPFALEVPPSPAAPPKVTERDMLDRLNTRYGRVYKNGSYRGRQYIRAEHPAMDVGPDFSRYHYRGARIADYVAMDLFLPSPGADMPYSDPRRTRSLHGHEVKVTRSDVQAELRDLRKAEAWARYCHYWWLVIPHRDLIAGLTLPDTWGVMVSSGTGLRAMQRPERRDPLPMPADVIGSLMRAVMQTEVRLGGGTWNTTALAEGNPS